MADTNTIAFFTRPYSFASIIIAHDRLGTVCNALDRHGDHFSDCINNSHDTYIQIASCFLEHGIIHDLNRTVSDRHGKTTHSKTDDPEDSVAF